MFDLVISRYITPRYITPRYITPRYITPQPELRCSATYTTSSVWTSLSAAKGTIVSLQNVSYIITQISVNMNMLIGL